VEHLREFPKETSSSPKDSELVSNVVFSLKPSISIFECDFLCFLLLFNDL
jgi:hypothetical protein